MRGKWARNEYVTKTNGTIQNADLFESSLKELLLLLVRRRELFVLGFLFLTDRERDVIFSYTTSMSIVNDDVCVRIDLEGHFDGCFRYDPDGSSRTLRLSIMSFKRWGMLLRVISIQTDIPGVLSHGIRLGGICWR